MSELYQNYQLIARIGRRTTSSLYLARSRPTPGEKVVIKLFDAIHLREEHEQESFLQELEYLLQLRHPHIVPILDGGIEKYHPYLVSMYAPGGSLRDRLAPQLPFDEALRIITRVGQALAYAHRWDILHAHIKPENILFDADDEPLLSDFTFYTVMESARLTQKPDPRTVRYMAPEQFTGRSGKGSDQYALGCLAYELLTGHPPFSAAAVSTWQAKHTSEQPPLPSRSATDLPAYIDAVLLRALAKDPSERYENIAAFIEDLTTPSLHTFLSPIPFFSGDEEEKGSEQRLLLTAGTSTSYPAASQTPVAASKGMSRVLDSIGRVIVERVRGAGRIFAAIGDVLLHGSNPLVWRTGIVLTAATLILMSMALIPLLAPTVAGPDKTSAYAAPPTSTPTLDGQTTVVKSTTVPVTPTITTSTGVATPTVALPAPTPTNTQEVALVPTVLPTPTSTPEPTVLPTPTMLPTPTPTLEATSTPPFVVLNPTPTPTLTLEPTPTIVSQPTPTPKPTPTAKPLPTPKPTLPTPKPTPTPVVPTPTPKPIPTPTPVPTPNPTPEPTPTPKPTPIPEPTPAPEPTPTPDTTPEPTPSEGSEGKDKDKGDKEYNSGKEDKDYNGDESDNGYKDDEGNNGHKDEPVDYSSSEKNKEKSDGPHLFLFPLGRLVS